jgi:hypothetical protein
MEKVLSLNHELVQRASQIRGLKIVFGTDAVAGSHGRNAEGSSIGCEMEKLIL